MLAEGIAEHQQLAHAGGQRHLGGLPGRDQALIEGADDRIGTGGGDGGHIEDGADGGAPAPDAAAAAPGAAVAIEGGDPDQGGNLAA